MSEESPYQSYKKMKKILDDNSEKEYINGLVAKVNQLTEEFFSLVDAKKKRSSSAISNGSLYRDTKLVCPTCHEPADRLWLGNHMLTVVYCYPCDAMWHDISCELSESIRKRKSAEK